MINGVGQLQNKRQEFTDSPAQVASKQTGIVVNIS